MNQYQISSKLKRVRDQFALGISNSLRNFHAVTWQSILAMQDKLLHTVITSHGVSMGRSVPRNEPEKKGVA